MLGGGTTARLISEGLEKVTIDNQDRLEFTTVIG